MIDTVSTEFPPYPNACVFVVITSSSTVCLCATLRPDPYDPTSRPRADVSLHRFVADPPIAAVGIDRPETLAAPLQPSSTFRPNGRLDVAIGQGHENTGDEDIDRGREMETEMGETRH